VFRGGSAQRGRAQRRECSEEEVLGGGSPQRGKCSEGVLEEGVLRGKTGSGARNPWHSWESYKMSGPGMGRVYRYTAYVLEWEPPTVLCGFKKLRKVSEW
jgi:hypothetical protein